MPLPNFLTVGAAKAGTTSLYYYLMQHPDISFPSLKEPKFFSSKFLNFPHNGIGDKSVDKYAIDDWVNYKELFQELNAKYIGEASPDYLYFHDLTAKEIKIKLGDIPIIIILRDPVKRAFSAYSYLVRDSRETLTFQQALKKEEERLSENWDFIWAYKNAGMYYQQVKTFIENFSRVKVIIFEEFIVNPLNTINEIFHDFDLKSLSDIDTIKHNVSGIPTNFFAKFILSRNNKISTSLREIAKKTIPRKILENYSAKSVNKIELNEEDAKRLFLQLEDVINKLEILINKDLAMWKKWK